MRKRHSETRLLSDRLGVKDVDILSVSVSWIKYYDNPPNLLYYGYSVNRVTDRILLIRYNL